ncbi:MAG: flagellar hook-length control protein FliK [Nitrospinota bacterium]|nr:MAG: flagellar hook-length control protein FliK [Nitrospinota bacterium]
MRVDTLVFTPQLSSDTQLRLRPGEVLLVRVLEELGSGKWLVRFHGLNLIAEAVVPLEKGATFPARVLDIGKTLTLQLLPSEPENGIKRIPLRDMLIQLGVTPTEEHEGLLQALLQRGLSPSLLPQLLPYQTAFPGLNPAIILLAWQMGLPPHPHLLASLETLTASYIPLGELLQELVGELQRLSTRHPSPVLERQIHALHQWQPAHPRAGLSSWTYQLSTSYEAAIFREEDVTGNLKAILLTIKHSLRSLPDGETTQASRLIHTLLQQLDAHLLVNQSLLEELPLFYFQVPYTLDGHSGTIAFTGKRKRLKDTTHEAFQLSFLAHTVYLGKLKVVVTAVGRRISCDLFAEDVPARDFIQQHQQELYESLSRLQYQVERIRCATAPPEAFLLEVIRTVPPLLQQWVSLDIRV